MTTTRHKKVGFSQNHAPHSFEYNNRTQRLAQLPSAFQSWEINRIALQKDNNSY